MAISAAHRKYVLVAVLLSFFVIYLGLYHDDISLRVLAVNDNLVDKTSPPGAQHSDSDKEKTNDKSPASASHGAPATEEFKYPWNTESVVSTSSTSKSTAAKTAAKTSAATAAVTTAASNDSSSGVFYADDAINTPAEEYLAFCIATKNQSLDLPEFLRHHYYHLNVTRFYIMDDATDPPMSTLSVDWGIPSSAITFKYWTPDIAASMPKGRMQTWIYQECINLFGSRHTWMAFFDVDEFLEVRSQNETFESILRGFEAQPHIGSIGINWRLHNSAGLLDRPESVRKAFDKCWDTDFTKDDHTQDERHVKSVVRTSRFGGIVSPHMFSSNDGSVIAGEDGLEAKPGFAWRWPITWNRLALHHYVVKSRAEYQEKINRWKDDTGKNWDFWDYIESRPTIPCTEMARFYP